MTFFSIRQSLHNIQYYLTKSVIEHLSSHSYSDKFLVHHFLFLSMLLFLCCGWKPSLYDRKIASFLTTQCRTVSISMWNWFESRSSLDGEWELIYGLSCGWDFFILFSEIYLQGYSYLLTLLEEIYT